MPAGFLLPFRFAKNSESVVDAGDGASVILNLGKPVVAGRFYVTLGMCTPLLNSSRGNRKKC